MITPEQEAEFRQNYAVLQGRLPDILNDREGMYALMRHGAIIDYFEKPVDALLFARGSFDDGLFSVQKVTNVKADLGWYSRVPNNSHL